MDNPLKSKYGSSFRVFLSGMYLGMLPVYFAVWLTENPDDALINLANIFVIIPIIGSLFGLHRIISFHGPFDIPLRSFPIMLCVGQLLSSVGDIIWLFYNILGNVPIPYPSVADGFYMAGVISWGISMIILYSVIDEPVLTGPYLTLILPLCGVMVTIVSWSYGGLPNTATPLRDLIKFVFDISYLTIGISNILLLVLLLGGTLSRKLSQEMSKALFIIFVGFGTLFLADIAFIITSTLSPNHSLAYSNANWVDFLYTAGFYVFSIGILYFPVHLKFATQAR